MCAASHRRRDGATAASGRIQRADELPLVDPRPAIARALEPQAAGAFVRSAADGHEIPLTSSDPGATAPNFDDRISKLEELANRRDRGELNDAEFEGEKQKLFSGDRT